jgi:hypothetical protein
MTRAGFKTKRFDSLKRQMNAYSFKFISSCEEHDGAWYHPSNNFGLTGERDHAITPRGKAGSSTRAAADDALGLKETGDKRPSAPVCEVLRITSKRAALAPRRFSPKLGGGEHAGSDGDDSDQELDFHFFSDLRSRSSSSSSSSSSVSVHSSLWGADRFKVPVKIRLGSSYFQSEPAVVVMPKVTHTIPDDDIYYLQDDCSDDSMHLEESEAFGATEHSKSLFMFHHIHDPRNQPSQYHSKTSHSASLLYELDCDSLSVGADMSDRSNNDILWQQEASSSCNEPDDENVMSSEVCFEESLDYILDALHRQITEEVKQQQQQQEPSSPGIKAS